MAYRHGIYTPETATEMPESVQSQMGQVVIGAAPVHLLSDYSGAVNVPVLCESLSDCINKLGYSEDFEKYPLCQSMYVNFVKFTSAKVVFINIFDPEKHCTEEKTETKTPEGGVIFLEGDGIIVKSVKVSDKENYTVEKTEGGVNIVFTENQTESVSVAYKKADLSKITKNDIIGGYNAETETRTGLELIRSVYPTLGIIPFIITAPVWSCDDTVGAVMREKAREINGRYKAIAVMDIDSKTNKTRAQAIAAKKRRSLDSNCIACYPMTEMGGHKIHLSAYLSAFIMRQSLDTAGVICSNPSNKKLDAENCILEDGAKVFYDTEDGNELNAEGIVTVINRNGFYLWGNNTAGYPDIKDPKDRFIMTKLSFNYIENDFIERYFSKVDSALDDRMVDDIITEESIRLSSYTAAGYIAGGRIYYKAGDNPREEILAGHFTFRTKLAANIPGEVIDNIFSFDIETLENAVLGTEV